MSFAPLNWKGIDLSKPGDSQLFLQQLSDLLNALNTARGLANILNGSSVLGATSQNFASLTANLTGGVTTVDLSNMASANIVAANTTVVACTLNLTNVSVGTRIQIRYANSSVGTITFKITASDPSGAPYAVFGFATGSVVDMDATGLNVLTGHQLVFIGTTYLTDLELLYVAT
jgi:hypothetical protein